MTNQNVTTISLDKELEKKLTEHAKHLSISRSALIRVACVEYLDRQKSTPRGVEDE